MKMPEAKSRANRTPMIMQLNPSAIIHAVNQCLGAEGRPLIPINADVSVRIPGGESSGLDIELDEGKVFLDIRWET